VPAEWIWRYITWFHHPSAAILASTPSIRQSLIDHGLTQVRHWGRGVDLEHFRPGLAPYAGMAALEGPVQLYVGRVAVEKNLEAFLASKHPGTKVVVGDGPARPALAARYPEAKFLGPMFGDALASAYAAADVFVFPSRTDTFGLVMIEALACGVPVAAYPVTGPIDVLTTETGAMDDDLTSAIGKALTLDRATCAAYGRSFTWRASALQFLHALVPLGDEKVAA
jgi:glycosyltransferase involved in cell wall biosynthesis